MLLILTDGSIFNPPSQEILFQSYSLVKTCDLDEQLCDMLDWNALPAEYYAQVVHRGLRDVKLLRECPELACRE
jgi:hypothetical protein